MDFLDDIFGKPDASPTLKTTDYAGAAKQGAKYNWGQLAEFEKQAPGLTRFMRGLFNESFGAKGRQAEDTLFNLGTQLANTGQTDLQGDFMAYSRRLGLENAAATGAPLSGSFGQSLASSYGANRILGQQLTGANILGNYAQTQANRAFSFSQPAQQVLQSNLINPQAFMQGAQQNNDIVNQNRYINFANSQSQSWFDSLLSQTAKSVVGVPFNFTQSAAGVVSNAPQIAASAALSYFGGPGAGAAVGQTMGQQDNTMTTSNSQAPGNYWGNFTPNGMVA